MFQVQFLNQVMKVSTMQHVLKKGFSTLYNEKACVVEQGYRCGSIISSSNYIG